MADESARAERPFGFKRITDYSLQELDIAVKIAAEHCNAAGLDFYTILRGVDAYMEKRSRKRRSYDEPTT
ncbi:MAG TPA: hypothetical protein VG758_21155 [Hyphomicrobiaceae bacterium]|jgi:hypothetical protein|nr:hypothetical protein [Hyphomicrobiaceae bacterium]